MYHLRRDPDTADDILSQAYAWPASISCPADVIVEAAAYDFLC